MPKFGCRKSGGERDKKQATKGEPLSRGEKTDHSHINPNIALNPAENHGRTTGKIKRSTKTEKKELTGPVATIGGGKTVLKSQLVLPGFHLKDASTS